MPLVSPEPPVAATAEARHNDLAHLQLEIARRADQLARLVISDRATDLALWLQAETEIFAHHSRGPRKATTVAHGQ
jgi:hypothetical protein